MITDRIDFDETFEALDDMGDLDDLTESLADVMEDNDGGYNNQNPNDSITVMRAKASQRMVGSGMAMDNEAAKRERERREQEIKNGGSILWKNRQKAYDNGPSETEDVGN